MTSRAEITRSDGCNTAGFKGWHDTSDGTEGVMTLNSGFDNREKFSQVRIVR
jgi:hypothetical protein